MANKDKYSALWLSYSSIITFLQCPRAFYLKHLYRDPKTGRKIRLVSPALSLGKAVHRVLESLARLPVEERFKTSLFERYEKVWPLFSGKKGGFVDKKIEEEYKKRGKTMLERVVSYPGILKHLAVRLKTALPYFWLSQEDDLILCGRIDWIEYLKETDSLHIVDFKTGRRVEPPNSLQLPIYSLIVSKTQLRRVAKTSYWYLERNNNLTEQSLADMEEVEKKVLSIGKEISLAKKLNRFKCPQKDGCPVCLPYEKILRGEGKFVGVDETGHSLYQLESGSGEEREIGSVIL